MLEKKDLGELAARIRHEGTKLSSGDILLLNLALLLRSPEVRDKILARHGLGVTLQSPGTNGIPTFGPASGVPAQNVLKVLR